VVYDINLLCWHSILFFAGDNETSAGLSENGQTYELYLGDAGRWTVAVSTGDLSEVE
jgi:hypothetical protein